MTRSRARHLALAALVVAAVALSACSSSNASEDFPATTTSTLPKASLRVNPDLIPFVSIPKSGCPRATATTVVFTVDDDGITPKCVTARLSQHLLFVNKGASSHNVTIEDVSADLDVGDEQPFGRIGRYFMPGSYAVASTTEPSLKQDPGFRAALVVIR